MRPSDYGANAAPKNHRVIDPKVTPHFVGTVVTRRWFGVDQEGRLTGAFRPETVYRPSKTAGRNGYYTAECDLNPLERMAYSWASKEYGRPVPLDLHHVAKFNCSCGFYSYFDRPSYWDLPRDSWAYVGAVVENFGRVTYGDYGMRSEKMRILALVIPYRKMPKRSIRRWFKAWLGKDVASRIAKRKRQAVKKLLKNEPELPVYRSWKEADQDFPHTKREDLP